MSSRATRFFLDCSSVAILQVYFLTSLTLLESQYFSSTVFLSPLHKVMPWQFLFFISSGGFFPDCSSFATPQVYALAVLYRSPRLLPQMFLFYLAYVYFPTVLISSGFLGVFSVCSSIVIHRFSPWLFFFYLSRTPRFFPNCFSFAIPQVYALNVLYRRPRLFPQLFLFQFAYNISWLFFFH